MGWVAVISLLGGAIAGVFAVINESDAFYVLAAGLLLTSVQLVLLQKAAAGRFTAAVIPVLAVNSVMLSSMFLWDPIRDESIVSIRFRVTEDYHIQAAVIGLLFSAAYTLGAMIGKPRGMQFTWAEFEKSVSRVGSSIQIPDGLLVAVGYAGIALTIYGRQGALLQGRYLEANGPDWAVALSNAAAPLAVLVLCIVSARPGPWRTLAAVGVGIWIVLLFGRASRALAAVPALIVFGRAFANGAKVRPLTIITAVIATVFLMQLSLVGRANVDGVGIIPLSGQLFTRPHEVFGDFSVGAILGNILFSGPLTAVVANREISPEALWISINPLPGGIAGWEEIRHSLRLTRSTPYNALGELASHGWLALVTVAFVVGLLLAITTRISASLTGAYAVAGGLLVLGITVFFSVSILQYNLRSSLRLIWYIVIGTGLIWATSVTFARKSTNSSLEADQTCLVAQPGHYPQP